MKGDKTQGVAAAFVGLDVKESIQLKTKILQEAKSIKSNQEKGGRTATIEGGVFAGPSKKILTSTSKKTLEDKSSK